MCETIKAQHPGKDVDYYKMFLATELLRLIIDNDWVNQTIFKQNPVKERKNNNAFEYFRSKTNGFQWQERVYRLAERVYNLRHIPNIENIIDDIIGGELVSRFAELEVGSHLFSRGIKFEFVVPTGEKGKDFDIKIIEPLIINCEVKHKIESTSLSDSTLTNTIRSANDQIPKDVPAIIFIKIPEEWISDKKLKEVIDRVFEPFFQRNSTHITGIMLRWEERDSINEGMFYWKFEFHVNKYFKLNDDIDLFLQQINGTRNNWVSLSDIIHKYML
jgi:hypothetical protein